MLRVAIDVTDITRLGLALIRTPALVRHLFHIDEFRYPTQTLCASFAAKECLIKMGILKSFKEFPKVLLLHEDSGNPYLDSTDQAIKNALNSIKISISHSINICVCVIISNE